MSRTGKLKKWVLRLAALLLGLTLLSAWATGKMYARYSTGVTYTDGARVAKFNITDAIQQDGTAIQQIDITGMQPGDTRNYTVTVTSDSEVAVYYTITAKTVYDNLPLTFTVLDSSNQPMERATIGANETDQKTYTLQVSWPSDKNSPDYAGKVDALAVTLTAVQVD